MDFAILSRTKKIFLEKFSYFSRFFVNRLFIQGRFNRDKNIRANFFPFGLHFFKFSLMEQVRKARNGQYFTTAPIADFMVSLISGGKENLRNFVESVSRRCEKMKHDYITPFLGYL